MHLDDNWLYKLCSTVIVNFRVYKSIPEKSNTKLKHIKIPPKISTSALLTAPKHLTVWITTNWKSLQKLKYQTTLPASWEICMQVKKQQSELDMEQQTGSKLGKKYVKAVYCHPAYLTSMQSTSCGMLGWMNHKLESKDCWEKH